MFSHRARHDGPLCMLCASGAHYIMSACACVCLARVSVRSVRCVRAGGGALYGSHDLAFVGPASIRLVLLLLLLLLLRQMSSSRAPHSFLCTCRGARARTISIAATTNLHAIHYSSGAFTVVCREFQDICLEQQWGAVTVWYSVKTPSFQLGTCYRLIAYASRDPTWTFTYNVRHILIMLLARTCTRGVGNSFPEHMLDETMCPLV